MTQLSPEDEALLRWSGELDGDPPIELERELDGLATKVRALPSERVPADALSAAMQRSERPAKNRWTTIRLATVGIAAAIALSGAVSIYTSVFTTREPNQGPGTTETSTTDPEPARASFSPQIFPKGENENLNRIRDVRARLQRIKRPNKPKPIPDQTRIPAAPPKLS